MIPQNTLELTAEQDGFDPRPLLTPGVQYDHLALKAAYLAACNASMWCVEGDPYFRAGTHFRQAIYDCSEVGYIKMPTVIDRHGEETDFLTAVIDAHPQDHPDFRIVPGFLVVLEWPEDS